MNNITLINCIVFFLINEVQSNVVLFADKEEFNDSAKVTFTCYSSIGSLDCSAEFLYNIKTLDTLRSSTGKCYHKQQLCSREKCSCSKECNTFILIITNHQYKNGDIIGCEVQHMNDGNILSTTVEIIYNGSVFRFHKTHVSTVAKPDRYSSTSPTTVQTDVIESNTGAETRIAVVIVIVIVLIIISCFWITLQTNQGRCANVPKGAHRFNISGRGLRDIRAERRENISNRRQNEFSVESVVDIPQGRPNEIPLERRENIFNRRQNELSVESLVDIPQGRPNEIPFERRENISNRRKNEFSVECLVEIPKSRPNEIPLESHGNLNSTQSRPLVAISTEESRVNINSTRSLGLAAISTAESPHEYLHTTRPRPLPSISTNIDSYAYLNITRPRSLSAISTKESHVNINSTRSLGLAAISTAEFRVNLPRTRPASFTATGAKRYLKKKRSSSYSAMSAKDYNSTSDDSIWTISSAESYRNFNKARPASFSTKDSSKNINSSLLSISSAVSVNSTTSIGSGVPLMDEVTHL